MSPFHSTFCYLDLLSFSFLSSYSLSENFSPAMNPLHLWLFLVGFFSIKYSKYESDKLIIKSDKVIDHLRLHSAPAGVFSAECLMLDTKPYYTKAITITTKTDCIGEKYTMKGFDLLMTPRVKARRGKGHKK